MHDTTRSCGPFVRSTQLTKGDLRFALALDLLDRAYPVFDVIRRCELVASDGEDVDGHRFEALARPARTKEIARGRSGRLAADDHAIARHHDVFDAPGEVGNARANLLEGFRQRLAREPLFVGGVGFVVGVAGLREKSLNILLLGLVQGLIERRRDLPRHLHR